MQIGIVGAGMTVPWFLEAAKLIPEMEVRALFARKEEKRKEICEKYQVPVAYDSYEKLLADQSIDVLYLPVPNHLHYSFTKQALEAGKRRRNWQSWPGQRGWFSLRLLPISTTPTMKRFGSCFRVWAM